MSSQLFELPAEQQRYGSDCETQGTESQQDGAAEGLQDHAGQHRCDGDHTL